jgi:putative peptidoglycan lipid II flippase
MRPAGAEQGHWEADTLPLTPPQADTLELPVVTAPAPPAAEIPVAPEPPAELPVPPARPDPGEPARRRSVGRWLAGRWLAWVVALLLVAAAAAAGIGLGRGGRHPGSGTGAGSALVIRTISSVDPSGGSGWRRTGSGADAVWRTEHYRSADFGRLKSGVGLLIDLGTARRLTSVRTVVEVSGTTLELRAGDSARSAPDGFRVLDKIVSAGGDTTLTGAGGGAHRYWLVWVPRLGLDGGGYSAGLRGLTVRG